MKFIFGVTVSLRFQKNPGVLFVASFVVFGHSVLVFGQAVVLGHVNVTRPIARCVLFCYKFVTISAIFCVCHVARHVLFCLQIVLRLQIVLCLQLGNVQRFFGAICKYFATYAVVPLNIFTLLALGKMHSIFFCVSVT